MKIAQSVIVGVSWVSIALSGQKEPKKVHHGTLTVHCHQIIAKFCIFLVGGSEKSGVDMGAPLMLHCEWDICDTCFSLENADCEAYRATDY